MLNRTVRLAIFGAAAVVLFPGVASADRVARLIRDLGHSSYKVRLQAAYALGAAKDRRAVQPLAGALADSEYAVRGAAAIALGNLKATDAVDALLKALTDDEEFVQAEAAKALGRIGDRRALDPLASHVEEKKTSWKVRLEAVKALGALGDRRALPVLVKVFDEEFDTDELGDEVKRAIRRLKGVVDIGETARTLGKADLDKNERVRAAYLLGIVGDARGLEALTRALEDKEVYIRYGATRSLMILGDTKAIEPLSQALERETHPRLRHFLYLCLTGLRRKAR